MDIETRLTNLENLVDSLVTIINNQKFYTDADIVGVRKGVVNVSDENITQSEEIEGLGDAIIEMSEIIYS